MKDQAFNQGTLNQPLWGLSLYPLEQSCKEIRNKEGIGKD